MQYGIGSDKNRGQQGPGIIGQHRGGGMQGGLRGGLLQGISSTLGGKIMLRDGGDGILGHLL